MKLAPPTLIFAAPASGSGKTTISLALLRALRDRGLCVGSLKIGPDYIDPMFHAAASDRPCYNLDGWAMREQTFATIAATGNGLDFRVIEGVMGLFDGAGNGTGSTADVAVRGQWPIVLIVDASGMAGSVAAVIHGFDHFRADTRIAGVILNRVGGMSHARILREAVAAMDIPVLGCVPRSPVLALPDRHLGLVPAIEHPHLESFLTTAAGYIAEHIALDKLIAIARAGIEFVPTSEPPIPPPAQVIAIASDEAFTFSYPWLIDSWRSAGAEVIPFSPLSNAVPSVRAECVYLPGGYPELHAAKIAANRGFLDGIRAAADRGAAVWGECGGYMVLGDVLIDASGVRHAMTGLLPVITSFSERRLSLGYRTVRTQADSVLGPSGAVFRGHEFHFATVIQEGDGEALFTVQDATGRDLDTAGRCRGRVAGSFIHLVDRAEAA